MYMISMVNRVASIVNQSVWFEWLISQCLFKMSMVSQFWSLWSISVLSILSVGQYDWSVLVNKFSSVTYYGCSVSTVSWSVGQYCQFVTMVGQFWSIWSIELVGQELSLVW